MTPAQKKKYNATYYALHKEEQKEKDRVRYREKMDSLREYARARYYAHKQREVQRSRDWRKKNPEKAKEQGLRRHGWTLEKYEEALRLQNQACAVCATPLTSGKGMVGKAHADHHHESKKPRAVLCGMCNSVLGHVKESPTLLRKLAEYLEFWL